MTPAQLRILHTAVKSLALTDDQYRMILRNTAGVASGKFLTNQTFEDVMAVLEDHGFRKPGDDRYWRNKVRARAQGEIGERLIAKIHALSKDQPYPAAAMARRFSNGRTDDVNRLEYREAYALVEALKQIHDRQTTKARQGQLFPDPHPITPSPRHPTHSSAPSRSKPEKVPALHGGSVEEFEPEPF